MIAKLLNNFNITAKQNQKFPFHFFFRFAAEGWGEETQEKTQGNFLVFAHASLRACPRRIVSRITTQSERTRQFQVTTRSARAISRNQGSIQNTFELRSIHTAKIQNLNSRKKCGRAEGATLMHSPRRTQNPKGFSTLRVARRLPIQFYE